MTTAVCLGCGIFRDDLTRSCPACGHDPSTDSADWGRQRLATDQFHSQDELDIVAAHVKAGQPVEFDPAAIQVGWKREKAKRLTAEHGSVPPPWIVFDEHPYSICWRMGGGESHLLMWHWWWPQQGFSEQDRIDYFRRWPPPHCWLAFLIQAIWDVEYDSQTDIPDDYFDRTAALGFGSREDYLRDLEDPKWLER